MNKWRKILSALCLPAAFIMWTVLAGTVDVQEIGPRGTSVGFAGLNEWARNLTGTHIALYIITDWLSLIPAGTMAAFALLGLRQWIMHRSIRKVDRSLLLLGVLYLTIAAVYVYFEINIINYRPVLIDGRLEASYPSSTTLLVLCVMPTALIQMRERIKSRIIQKICSGLVAAFTAFMITARFFSGVHWLSDIIGGILLGGGLTRLYLAVLPNKKA